MARITWDKAGERFYETGVDHGVLYPKNAPGVPWNGLTSVEQAVAGGESEAYYFDGIKYYSNIANQDFQATLSAFTYPREFEACEGSIEMAQGLVFSNQSVRYFGLAWRTKIGTDQDGDFAYRLHIVYNLTAEPTTKTHETVSDSPSPSNFQWTLDALPDVPGSSLLTSNNSPDTWVWPAGVGMSGWPNGPDGNTPVKGWKATPYIWVDSDKVTKTNWDSLNDHLYGTLHSPAYLPSQVDIMNMMNGLDVPKTPAFAWTDPNPDDGGDDGDGDGDDDGGGSTLGDLGALLVTATPAPDWTGFGQFPPYNLEYPSLNNSGEYPEDAAIVAAALSDSSDASFITIAHSIGVQANSYYYPMMLSQQAEFEREWPSMPGPGAPGPDNHFLQGKEMGYRLNLVWDPPAGGHPPTKFGIRMALDESAPWPRNTEYEYTFYPTFYTGGYTGWLQINLSDDSKFDGTFKDYEFTLDPDDITGAWSGTINLGYVWFPMTDGETPPQWWMRMRVSRVWLY